MRGVINYYLLFIYYLFGAALEHAETLIRFSK